MPEFFINSLKVKTDNVELLKYLEYYTLALILVSNIKARNNNVKISLNRNSQNGKFELFFGDFLDYKSNSFVARLAQEIRSDTTLTINSSGNVGLNGNEAEVAVGIVYGVAYIALMARDIASKLYDRFDFKNRDCSFERFVYNNIEFLREVKRKVSEDVKNLNSYIHFTHLDFKTLKLYVSDDGIERNGVLKKVNFDLFNGEYYISKDFSKSMKKNFGVFIDFIESRLDGAVLEILRGGNLSTIDISNMSHTSIIKMANLLLGSGANSSEILRRRMNFKGHVINYIREFFEQSPLINVRIQLKFDDLMFFPNLKNKIKNFISTFLNLSSVEELEEKNRFYADNSAEICFSSFAIALSCATTKKQEVIIEDLIKVFINFLSIIHNVSFPCEKDFYNLQNYIKNAKYTGNYNTKLSEDLDDEISNFIYYEMKNLIATLKKYTYYKYIKRSFDDDIFLGEKISEMNYHSLQKYKDDGNYIGDSFINQFREFIVNAEKARLLFLVGSYVVFSDVENCIYSLITEQLNIDHFFTKYMSEKLVKLSSDNKYLRIALDNNKTCIMVAGESGVFSPLRDSANALYSEEFKDFFLTSIKELSAKIQGSQTA